MLGIAVYFHFSWFYNKKQQRHRQCNYRFIISRLFMCSHGFILSLLCAKRRRQIGNKKRKALHSDTRRKKKESGSQEEDSKIFVVCTRSEVGKEERTGEESSSHTEQKGRKNMKLRKERMRKRTLLVFRYVVNGSGWI